MENLRNKFNITLNTTVVQNNNKESVKGDQEAYLDMFRLLYTFSHHEKNVTKEMKEQYEAYCLHWKGKFDVNKIVNLDNIVDWRSYIASLSNDHSQAWKEAWFARVFHIIDNGVKHLNHFTRLPDYLAEIEQILFNGNGFQGVYIKDRVKTVTKVSGKPRGRGNRGHSRGGRGHSRGGRGNFKSSRGNSRGGRGHSRGGRGNFKSGRGNSKGGRGNKGKFGNRQDNIKPNNENVNVESNVNISEIPEIDVEINESNLIENVSYGEIPETDIIDEDFGDYTEFDIDNIGSGEIPETDINSEFDLKEGEEWNNIDYSFCGELEEGNWDN